MKLASLVEKRKRIEEGNQPIIRHEIEEKRINQAGQWAEELGLNPNLARMIQQILILQSCHTQMAERELGINRDEERLYEEDRESWLRHLRENLLKLAAHIVASYDQIHGQNALFAIRSYLDYEKSVIQREITVLSAMRECNLAIDLGCATGRLTFDLAGNFRRIIGIDISPDMINFAHAKLAGLDSNIDFRLADFDSMDFSEFRKSVSLIVSNMGTASETQDVHLFLNRLAAMLHKDGRFILSFYNRSALHQQSFAPWQIPLISEFDTVRHCLSIDYQARNFLIYARPYTVGEIKEIFTKTSLLVTEITTYPTIASILPQECFTDEQGKKAVSKLDRQLLSADAGAYILVTGRMTK
jgi:SAM-dependent methyltransferase